MSDLLEFDGALINSIIGEGSRFNGDLAIKGLFRVDGDFSGSIRAEGKVLIGRKGRAKSNIDAKIVVVGGAVKGNITAIEKVVVLSSGVVLGNIATKRLIIEDGAITHGNLIVNSELTDDLIKERSAAPLGVGQSSQHTSQSNPADIDRFNPSKNKAKVVFDGERARVWKG